jgi:hypothetical protein
MDIIMSDSHRRSVFWRNIAIIVSCAVICAVIYIVISYLAWIDNTVGQRRHISKQIDKSLEVLFTKCPPDMMEEEWNAAVGWTWQLSGNSVLMKANLNDLRSFQCELEKRVKGKTDMNLILWIWDEHAKLTPAGQWYKQQFQKVMIDDMQQISNGGTPSVRWSIPGDKWISP